MKALAICIAVGFGLLMLACALVGTIAIAETKLALGVL